MENSKNWQRQRNAAEASRQLAGQEIPRDAVEITNEQYVDAAKGLIRIIANQQSLTPDEVEAMQSSIGIVESDGALRFKFERDGHEIGNMRIPPDCWRLKRH